MEPKFSEPLANGVLFPLLGLGTWKRNGEALNIGLKSILNYPEYELIDSAAFYKNEHEIAEFLASLSDNDRKRFFITTKLWKDDANGAEATYNSCLQSMKNLNVTTLDLYLMHWPGCGDLPLTSPENRQRRLDNWRGMERLYKEGKVRAIGVSNFRIQHLQQLIDDGAEIIPMVNQVELHPMCWEVGLFDYCKKHKIRIQAYSSLGSGSSELLDHPIVQSICKESQLTPALVLYRWALQHDVHIIPSSVKPLHIGENTKVFEISLSHSQMERLDSMQTDERHFCWDPRDCA